MHVNVNTYFKSLKYEMDVIFRSQCGGIPPTHVGKFQYDACTYIPIYVQW